MGHMFVFKCPLYAHITYVWAQYGQCVGDSWCICSFSSAHYMPILCPHNAHNMPISGTDSSNPRRNVPPKLRTHADTVKIGEYLLYTGARDRLTTARMEEVKKNTGVNGYCIFALIHFFDIILDFTLDWMHIQKGIWDGNLLPLVLGKGRPTKPTPNQVLPNTRLEPTRAGITRRTNKKRLDRFNKYAFLTVLLTSNPRAPWPV